MKNCLMIWMLAIGTVACEQRGSTTAPLAHIPGRYVARYESEFAHTWDTLDIQRMDKSKAIFQIIRRRKHQYKDNARTGADKYQVQTWRGLYQSAEGRILIENTGRGLIVDAANKQIIMGISHYDKISE